MRHYTTFPIAINEIRRELSEMAIIIRTKSVQNMDVSNNDDYLCHELQDYSYRVTQPDYTTIPLKSPEWFEAEFKERTCGKDLNPGEAWRQRENYWGQFLNSQGKFDYSYPHRLSKNLLRVIDALKQDPNTRRAFLTILGNDDPPNHFGVRFPCSIGYHLLYRQGQLNLTYYLRSSDFMEHFNYDIALADRLKCYIANQLGMNPGYFTHVVGSLHCFRKDIRGVF
jgi:thymidylate synthase